MIMEVCGIPPQEVLSVSQRKKKFFNDDNVPILVQNSRGKVRKPGTKVIEDILDCKDSQFVDFVEKCLDWNPESRMSPDAALRHPWILEGLPPKVLIHH
jgi:dual specificity tyrosine-phosphorylation-regulated kinase 2/3/4